MINDEKLNGKSFKSCKIPTPCIMSYIVSNAFSIKEDMVDNSIAGSSHP